MRTAPAWRHLLASIATVVALAAAPVGAGVQITPFTQAVAEAAAGDAALAAFYRAQRYAPIWTGPGAEDAARREALLVALDSAPMHGLPAARFDPGAVRALMAAARSGRDLGRIEVELSRVFLDLASALRSGLLTPSRVVPAIKRQRPVEEGLALLTAFEAARPNAFLSGLAPQTRQYALLFGAKADLEQQVAAGGWGEPLVAGRLEFGDTGPQVVLLRDRLVATGYLGRTAIQVYDGDMRRAVQAFQRDHGLAPDGIVGGATLSELNRGPAERLGQVLVAMERERWMNRDLGARHVWVNLADFTARILVDGETVFETRSVIGKNANGRETPEFSDQMEYMMVNPSWYVPRSIVVDEYLPALRNNPYVHRQWEITDRRGRAANRARGFRQYTAETFPFSMRQPPGPDNALGRVKFMFPNRYNIYLHDTPAKSLFDGSVRAYSHGCIRLQDPFGFARVLLGFQSGDPDGDFRRALETGRETKVPLVTPLPVHLVYRTAIAKPEGGMEYRGDIYGRDARILAALRAEGVAMPGGAS